MNFVEAIIRKRDGHALSREQVLRFVEGAATGDLPPEQLAAMLMAICLQGMTDDETRWLTGAMLESGDSWRLADEVPGLVDKHSTGGVGDTVSLVMAPLLSSLGVPVAMMAGRGLGHSQGTLDKLDAVPGFSCDRNRAEALGLIDRCGVAIVAQNDTIVPADRVLYALRDVTGTVPSLPLIVGSIMSKKLALGAQSLVLDVKWGRGAFRHTVEDAVELAQALRQVARGMDLSAEAVVTDMNEPLGPALGNACEVRAALDVLEGSGSAAMRRVSVRLAATVMALSGHDPDQATQRLEAALDDGSARAAWDSMVRAHGGNPDPALLVGPESERDVTAANAGWVAGVDAAALGWIAVDLGAGRRTRDEALAYGAGLIVHARIGDRVERDQPLATILVGERPVDLDAMAGRVRSAFEIGSEPVVTPELILGTIEEIDSK
jgi:pyrimidine-nucleoside phosphorylase